ncbi:MAG: hypothetical protein IPK53_17690 [bacterium]|nr:hypothetical protein [bacterium]
MERARRRGDVVALPILFITVACGALLRVSFDHRQRHEFKTVAHGPDAKKVGYGAMLLEAMVAVVSLSCVMILSKAIADLGGKTQFHLCTWAGALHGGAGDSRQLRRAVRADGLHDLCV